MQVSLNDWFLLYKTGACLNQVVYNVVMITGFFVDHLMVISSFVFLRI